MSAEPVVPGEGRSIEAAKQKIRNLVTDAFINDTANTEMRREGYSARGLDRAKLDDLLDALVRAARPALPAPEPPKSTLCFHTFPCPKCGEALGQILRGVYTFTKPHPLNMTDAEFIRRRDDELAGRVSQYDRVAALPAPEPPHVYETGRTCWCGEGSDHGEFFGAVMRSFMKRWRWEVTQELVDALRGAFQDAVAALPAEHAPPDLKNAPQEYHLCESCGAKTPHRFDGEHFVCYAADHSELGAAALWVLKAHVSHGDQAIIPGHLITDLARALENSRGSHPGTGRTDMGATVHTHVDYWLDMLLDHARQRTDFSDEIARDRAAIHALFGSRPALTGSPDAFLPYLKHKLTCAIGKMEFAPPKRWPDPSTLESCNLPCDCGLAELLAGVRGARGAAPEQETPTNG